MGKTVKREQLESFQAYRDEEEEKSFCPGCGKVICQCERIERDWEER